MEVTRCGECGDEIVKDRNDVWWVHADLVSRDHKAEPRRSTPPKEERRSTQGVIGLVEQGLARGTLPLDPTRTPEEIQAKREEVQQEMKKENHLGTGMFLEGWLHALDWMEAK
jgi:hypothetical protein